MVLKKLQLQNFKGMKEFVLEIDGSCSVYGTNASGKTTLADAMSWLLYDKASTEEVAFSPKPKDKDGQEIHFLETSVIGEFDCIKLQKVMKEKWTKKRGSTDQVYDGNTIEYYTNDVPVTKRDYDKAIAEICPTDIMQVLTNPAYFSERMSWQARRELLLKVCGDLTQDDVIQSDDELRDLPGVLNGHTVDEFQVISKASMKRINQQLAEIPARIDEATNNMSGEADHEEYLRIKMKQAQDRADRARDSLAESDVASEIRSLELEYKNEELSWNNEQSEKNADTARKILDAKTAIDRIDHDILVEKWTTGSLENELKVKSGLRENLLQQYKALKKSTWTGDTICPTCGQQLPYEKINEAMDKFRADTDRMLSELKSKAEAECSKDILQELRTKIGASYSKVTDLIRQREAANELYMLAQASQKAPEPFQNSDVAISLRKRIEALKTGSGASDEDVLKRTIESAEADVRDCMAKLARIESDRKLQARIEELEDELQMYQEQADDIVTGQQMCERFLKTKIGLLTDSINNRFKSVGFKLFADQINGGVKEVCEVMVPGDGSLVEYKSANNAARINAGLEIIDALTKYYGVKMPVFVDNAESVVNVTNTGLQLIKLYVSGDDEILRVEGE